MASSLDPLRRHSKLIFTILGVICMITFVVGSQLEELLAPKQTNSRNEVVATWSGGTIRQEDLYRMQVAHERCQKFLGGVARATRAAGGQTRAIGLRRISGERELIQNLLLADEAKKMGVTVNDDAVRNYLNDFCSYQLTEAQINDIAHEATGPSVSRDELYEQLKRELTAQEALLAMNSDRVAGNISVADAWDYHGRLFRRMTVEAYPFETAAFLDEVKGSPNEADKRKIFEDFRLNPPDPESAEPGFYRPLKLAFAYAKIDLAPFLDEAKKKITEEQIKAEYDTQVKQGRLKVPVETPKKPEDEKKEEEKKEGDEKKDPAPEQPKAEEKKDEKKDEKPAEPPKKCGDELEGDELAQADDKKEPAKQTPEKKEPEKKEPATTPDSTKPEEKLPDEAAPTDTEKKPEKKEPEMRTQTLEEVRDAILTQLAQPEANQKSEKAVTGVSDAIRDYYSKYLRYQESLKRPLAGAKPETLAPLDIEAIAAKYNLVGASTPLVNRYEVQKYDIGRNGQEFDRAAMEMRLDFSLWLVPFPNFAFDPRVGLYSAREIGSSEQDVRYIYCVTEKQDAENPKYEDADVQKEIIAAWKKGEALKLAKQAAEKLAKEAEGKESLKDVAPDKAKLITPPPFTYYTYGAVPFGMGTPRFSPVDGVPNPQREFFETVYELPVGGTGVTTDGGFNTVYAVKLLAQTPPDEVLREQFLKSGINQQILSVAQIELSRRGVAQLKKLEQSHKLKWSRPAGYLEGLE